MEYYINNLSHESEDLLKKNISFKESDKPFINDVKRHNIKVIDRRISSKDIKSKYLENIENQVSNKILVVCNTIREAQKIYDELKDGKTYNADGELNALFILK